MSPTINKIQRKPKSTKHTETDDRILRQKAYNSSDWKKLRLCYLKEHALCESCLSRGVVTPAAHCHHRRSPFLGKEINWALMLDYNNLEALCPACHALEHQKEKGYVSPEEVLKQLDALFDNNIPDSYFDNDDKQVN